MCDVMYNAFYSFEALTRRNMDDVVCGLCGTVGEVYYGDGNSKNCCTVKGVSRNIIMFNLIFLQCVSHIFLILTVIDIIYLLLF